MALRRGHDPAAEALRELFQELLVDEQSLRRIGALIAWAAATGEPAGTAVPALREALSDWFGTP